MNNNDLLMAADGEDTSPFFITKWTSADGQIVVPLVLGETYDFEYRVDDGAWVPHNTDSLTIVGLPTVGERLLEINPLDTFGLPCLAFDDTGDKLKVTELLQWGDSVWTTFAGMFFGCSNMTGLNIQDTPDATQVIDVTDMFRNASLFTSDLSLWDVSNIITFNGMFNSALVFDSDLSAWNVSSATKMAATFFNTPLFTSDLSSWDVSNVTAFDNTFRLSSLFTSDLSSWDVSSCTTFNGMFNSALAFNSNLSSWNTSITVNMGAMFNNAAAFNSDISSWNVSSTTTMSSMLSNCGLSQANYDALLDINTGWANQVVQNGVTLGATGLTYSLGGDAETGRTALINTYSWTILGDTGV